MAQYHRLILASLLSLALLVGGCKQEPDCSRQPADTYYEIEASDSIFIPYKGHDTLMFQRTDTNNNIIDTITLIGQGASEVTELDHTIKSIYCPQSFWARCKKIEFKLSQTETIVNYKVKPGGFPNFIISYKDSAEFDFFSLNMNNPSSPHFYNSITICGLEYYRVNTFFAGVNKESYILIQKNGEIIRFSVNNIVFNLIKK